MKFDELTPFQREMIGDAVGHQHVKRLRAAIGVPVCVAIAAVLIWVFVFRDGGAGGFGWVAAGLFAILFAPPAVVLLLQALTDHSVRDVVESLGLAPAARRASCSNRFAARAKPCTAARAPGQSSAPKMGEDRAEGVDINGRGES